MKKKKNMLLCAGIGCCMAFTTMCASPGITAGAAEYPAEIILGAFWESDENTTDTLYWSLDGVNFYELAEAYTDATPTEAGSDWIADTKEGYKVSTLHDPGILYRDGVFWMISGTTSDHSTLGRRYAPMLGYSFDLEHWSYPVSGNDRGVGVAVMPPGEDKHHGKWDAVAPDFFVDDDGTIWITVSMGYYDMFHHENGGDVDTSLDEMQPYLIKVENIIMPDDADPENKPWAEQRITYSDAVPINLPVYTYKDGDEEVTVNITNRIDSSFYKEGDCYYLLVKKDGVTNEIYRTKTLDLDAVQNPDNWELVSDDAVTGFEGPSLTKFNGRYYLYADKLIDYPFKEGEEPGENGVHGVYVSIGSTATTGELDKYTGWLESNRYQIVGHGANNEIKTCRHGSVITLTDPEAIKLVWDLRAKTQYADTVDEQIQPVEMGWYKKESFRSAERYNGKEVWYWYENDVRMGVDPNKAPDDPSYRGKEIHDPAVEGVGGWYWLDAVSDGSIAVSKEVFLSEDGGKTGKWVLYGWAGEMRKGQYHDPEVDAFRYYDLQTGEMLYGLQEIPLLTETGKDQYGYPIWSPVEAEDGTTTKWVYYDDVTGYMLKGYHVMNGKLYLFDQHDGTCINGWYTYPQDDAYGKKDELYWYEFGERMGYKIDEEADEPGTPDEHYRGKEIYDPLTDAWYWCDNVQKGALARDKDVYQESYAGIFADMEDGVNGKWVRYDGYGKMIKGWDWGALNNKQEHYFFEMQTGAMAKGDVWIYYDENNVPQVSPDNSKGGEHWLFDQATGLGTQIN